MKRKANISVKSIIAILLVAVSFAMLLLPVANISLNTEKGKCTVKDVLKNVAGVSVQEIQTELIDGFDELMGSDNTDTYLIARKVAVSICKILDGKVSLLEATSICANVGKLLSVVKSFDDTYLSASDRYVKTQMVRYSTNLKIAVALIWCVFVLLMLLALASILALKNNRVAWPVVYTTANTLLLSAMLVTVGKLNAWIQPYFWDEYSGALKRLGILNLNLFHVSSTLYISVICAVAAIVISRLNLKREKFPGKTGQICPHCGTENKKGAAFCILCGEKLTSQSNWTCSCGQSNKGAFCTNCGKPRQEPATKVLCRKCGAENAANAKFCSKCGSVLTDTSPNPADATRAICPECGSENNPNARFCSRCGYELKAAPKKVCIRCGKPFSGSGKYCPNCKFDAGNGNDQLKPPEDL